MGIKLYFCLRIDNPQQTNDPRYTPLQGANAAISGHRALCWLWSNKHPSIGPVGPMHQLTTKQPPLSIKGGKKSEFRTQFAALPYRIKDGKLQVLMITSRGSGRWILPKGWPMHDRTPARAAAREAWEEAGIKGSGPDHSIGLYSYEKLMSSGERHLCIVVVYPLRVKTEALDYPEAGQRKRKWMTPKKAARKVREPELATLIARFRPKDRL